MEDFARRGEYLLGIGHKKYSIESPDPRVKVIDEFSKKLENSKYYKFAKEVEKITTDKKINLILNVDGAIAAVMLDYLSELEGYNYYDLRKLVDIEFFNVIFVISRSIGFASHYLDQKRMDEGLFRLSSEDFGVVSL